MKIKFIVNGYYGYVQVNFQSEMVQTL